MTGAPPEPQDVEPIRLVYVASIGRSGSTLLESILGAHTEVETVGELHLWPHEIAQGGVTLCGSGKTVLECPFWTEMRARVDPLAQRAPQIHRFREKHNGGRTLRPERLGDFRPGVTPGELEQRVMQYAWNNYEVFRAFADLVQDTTGRRPTWLVDASKDPYRLAWFARSGLFDLVVIHMVKDPRGFSYSVTRDWIHGDRSWKHAGRLYYTARQSGAWLVQNELLRAAARHLVPPDRYRLVRYEDLARDPEATMRSLFGLLDVPFEAEAIENFRSGSPFTIAGNPMRYRSGGIVLDEKWKSHLPPSSRRLSNLVTAPVRARYGYR